MEQGHSTIKQERSGRERLVAEFQRKYNSPGPFRIEDAPRTTTVGENGEYLNSTELREGALILQELEKALAGAHLDRPGDPRILWAKLMVSELSEVLDAMAERDEVALADGLADLEYVTVGTATTFDIPLGAVFKEVHTSNMTKSTVQESVANHSGDKGKGLDYQPPRVAEVIAASRR